MEGEMALVRVQSDLHAFVERLPGYIAIVDVAHAVWGRGFSKQGR
jgi:hypothetical protein